VVRVYTTGGGGYGSPLERDPEAVRLDVLDRRVSREAARDIYGVVLDGRDMVDHEATAAARSRLRAATTNGNASAVFDRGKEYIALFGRSQHTIMEGDDES
jgi:N-methylhydantoinase B